MATAQWEYEFWAGLLFARFRDRPESSPEEDFEHARRGFACRYARLLAARSGLSSEALAEETGLPVDVVCFALTPQGKVLELDVLERVVNRFGFSILAAGTVEEWLAGLGDGKAVASA